MSAASRIVLWFFVFLAILAAALVLPQVAVGGDTGLAAGATAAVTFLALLLVALVVAIALLVITIRHRAVVPIGAKIAGFLPLPLLIAGVIAVVVVIQQRKEERQPDQPPSRALTPTATGP